MTTQHIETLVIGAGQAGLATGFHLHQLGREFLVVDGNERLGDNWRQHYDSLRLYSPAKYDGLPGLEFPAEPWHFPGKDEVADYLERYAVELGLPVRLRTRVGRLERRDGGGFTARLGTDTVTCDNVVLATGTFGRTPRVPAVADRLAPEIRQLHSLDYRNPAQLRPGRTLVVGASHSGCDIAHEVAGALPTVLAGPDRGNIPLDWDSPRFRVAIGLVVFAWRHVLTRRTPVGRKQMRLVRTQGAPTARIKARHLADRGVERVTDKVTGVSPEGMPVLADGATLEVANVVWCTGFRQDYDWIGFPILGEDGWPEEYRGVSASVPGLFFCGLAFQYAFGSMVLPGVGRDAEYLARRIAARGRSGHPVERRRAVPA